jgi:hypothetical protein
MDIRKRTEIIQRFDNVLRKINKLRDELKNEVMKDMPVVKVSVTELIGIGMIIKNKGNMRYSVLRNEWLNNIQS